MWWIYESTKGLLSQQRIEHPYLFYFFTIVLCYYIYKTCFGKKRGGPRRPKPHRLKLSRKEIDTACEEWKPEPIIPENWEPKDYEPKCILSGVLPRIHVENYGKNTLNFSSFNFLGYNLHPVITSACGEAIKKYGVGSCGPRSFYGSYDVHIESEADVAKFIGKEDCMIYSFGQSVGASMIPCFLTRADFVLVDDGAGYLLQSGAIVSKSNIFKFKHNNLESLEEEMVKINKIVLGCKRLPRKLLCIQGVYEKYGDVVNNIKGIIKLAKRYKFYICLDDSYAFGVLGQTGKGTCEQFDVPLKDIDFILGSLEYSVASYGGFCVASKLLTVYQRFFGYGYMFSCSLPPYCSVATITSLKLLQKDSTPVNDLRFNTKLMIDILMQGLGDKPTSMYHLGCHYYSPIIHIFFDCVSSIDELRTYEEKLLKDGVSISIPEYTKDEWDPVPTPSFRISISAGHTKRDIEEGAEKLVQMTKEIVEIQMKKTSINVKERLKDF